MTTTELTEEIRRVGQDAGLDALGFAGAAPFSDYRLGDAPRRDPRPSLPEARSIIVARALPFDVWL